VSGYRESSFDPSAGGDYGPPLRPYNWVQWTGNGFIAVAVMVLIAFFAAKAHLLSFNAEDSLPLVGSNLVLCGLVLVNSRRHVVAVSPGTKRRRSLIILSALAICAIVAADIIYLKGA